MKTRLFIIVVLIALIHSIALAQSSLLNSTSLTYAGAFKVPLSDGSHDLLGDSAGTALSYNPARNSLILVGRYGDQYLAEISIPALSTSTNIGNLNTATFIQKLADPLAGRLDSICPGDTDLIQGTLMVNNHLYVDAVVFYDSNGCQSASHFQTGPTFSSPGTVVGPKKVGTLDPGIVAGEMFAIPSNLQSALGGDAVTGLASGISISQRLSLGPSAHAITIANIGTSQTVSSTALVYYPYDHPLGVFGEGKSSQLWSGPMTWAFGPVMEGGSALWFGIHGTGKVCYGDVPSECNDKVFTSKGYHAYPYRYQVWAYDTNDLIAVKQGTKTAWSIVPYSYWTMTFPFSDISNSTQVMNGVAYDSANKRIYIAVSNSWNDEGVVIYCYTISSPSTEVAAPTELRKIS
jgi:hypothetical protein